MIITRVDIGILMMVVTLIVYGRLIIVYSRKHYLKYRTLITARRTSPKLSLKAIEKKIHDSSDRFQAIHLFPWLMCLAFALPTTLINTPGALFTKELHFERLPGIAELDDFTKEALTESVNRIMPDSFYRYPKSMETNKPFKYTLANAGINEQQYAFTDSMIYWHASTESSNRSAKELHFIGSNIHFIFFLNLHAFHAKKNLLDTAVFVPIRCMTSSRYLSQTFWPHRPFFYVKDSSYSSTLKRYLYSGVFAATMPWKNPEIHKVKRWPLLSGTFRGLDIPSVH